MLGLPYGVRLALTGLFTGTACLGLAGCSDNYGTPPLPVGSRIAVREESFAGPIIPRAGSILTGTATRLWVATDRGLYHARPRQGTLAWYPGHFGFERGDGTAQVDVIADLAVDPTGEVAIHVSGSVGANRIVVTRDGGRTFRQIPLPNVIAGMVQRVGVLPPSELHAGGAYVAVQGTAVFVRSVAEDAWVEAMLPSSPVSVGPLAGNAGGGVLLAAETDQGWQLWTSRDGGRSFTTFAASPGGEVLDVALTEQGVVSYVSTEAVVSGSSRVDPPAGARFVGADVRVEGEGVAYLTRSEGLSGENPRVHRGRLPATGLPEEFEPPVDGPQRGLLITSGSAYVLAASADIWELRGPGWFRHAFGGAHLSWGAIAVDPRSDGSIFLGSVDGRAWRDGAEGPAELGRPRNVSEIRALLSDPNPNVSAGLYAGTFGVQWHPDDGAPWEDRSEGQFSYLLEEFSSPVTIETLAADPADPRLLWLGAIRGNGPYRSYDGGLLWRRVHGGLGQPGSIFGEDGLPAATSVRAFVFDGDRTWMGTFRGGVWWLDPGRLDDELDDVWVQSNRGLPDVADSPVDTCCFDPAERAVDVRDLLRLADGTLLAATGWGIYREEGASGVWERSSEGLTNGDIYSLASHPTRRDWVLAAARGNADNGDWLFLSRDGGLVWFAVDSTLRAWYAKDVVWSDPSTLQIVALLDGGGAWRMELAP